MTTRKRLTKAERQHQAQLARQRRRAYTPPGQADRNAVGVAFCRAMLRSVQSHREAKRGKDT